MPSLSISYLALNQSNCLIQIIPNTPSTMSFGFGTPHLARRCAFSLTELIIVISIVAILATILLPAIAHVRHKSRMAQSASNLRQIGSAFFMYVGDNGGYTPGNGQNTMFIIDSTLEQNNNNRLLHKDLQPYLGDSVEVWRSMADEAYFHKYHNGTATSYAHALGTFYPNTNGGYTFSTRSISLLELQESATRGLDKRPLFAEADWEIRMPARVVNGNPINDQYNVYFLDGRVAQYQRTQVQGRYRTDW